MKIRLDTENKTIRVEEGIQLGELMTAIKRILPNGEWKEFKLEPKVVELTSWSNPIYIERVPNYYPWYYSVSDGTTLNNVDSSTFTGGDANITLCSSAVAPDEDTVFNIEI